MLHNSHAVQKLPAEHVNLILHSLLCNVQLHPQHLVFFRDHATLLALQPRACPGRALPWAEASACFRCACLPRPL